MNQKRRYSEKRNAIWTILQQTSQHPSAEQVYQLVRRQYPQISLGTVYRNLTQFKAEGKIKSVGVVNGQERFDASVAPHAHFICRRCGKVLDIPLNLADEERAALVMRSHPVLVEQQELVFHGLCSDCQTKSEQ